MEAILLFAVLVIGIAGVSLSIYGKYGYAPKRRKSRDANGSP
jgi:hypothetical protein